MTVRPRVDEELYQRLLDIGLDVNDAIKIALKYTGGTKVEPSVFPSVKTTKVSNFPRQTFEDILSELKAINVELDSFSFDGNSLEVTTDTGVTVNIDLSTIGGTTLGSAGLGGLGTGLLSGIAGAAGALWGIDASGNAPVKITDGTTVAGLVAAANSLKTTMYDTSGTAIFTSFNPGRTAIFAYSGAAYQAVRNIANGASNSAMLTGLTDGTGILKLQYYQADESIIATGSQTEVDMSGCPMGKFTMVLIGNDNTGTFTSCSVDLEASMDGTNWLVIKTGTLAAAGSTRVSGEESWRYFRANVTALNVTGDADLDIQVLFSAR